AMASSSWYVMLIPKIDTVRDAPKNLRKIRGSCGVGFHTHVDNDRNPSITDIGTTILVTSEVPRRPFMIAMCSTAPSRGAANPSTNSSAIGAGHPQPKRTCQYRNA